MSFNQETKLKILKWVLFFKKSDRYEIFMSIWVCLCIYDPSLDILPCGEEYFIS